MSDLAAAIAHLEDAETTIMSWWARMDDAVDDEAVDDIPFSTMLSAVLRSVSRAAGIIEASNGSKGITPRYTQLQANDGGNND